MAILTGIYSMFILLGNYRWFQKATVKCITSNQLQRLAILNCRQSGIIVNTLLIVKTCQV